VALEDLRRADLAAPHHAPRLPQQHLGKVGALAVDCAVPLAHRVDRAGFGAHVGDDASGLRAAHHRHLEHASQEVLDARRVCLLEQQQAKVAAAEETEWPHGREQVRLHGLARGVPKRRRCQHCEQRAILSVQGRVPRERQQPQRHQHRRYPSGMANDHVVLLRRHTLEAKAHARAPEVELGALVPQRERDDCVRELMQPERDQPYR